MLFCLSILDTLQAPLLIRFCGERGVALEPYKKPRGFNKPHGKRRAYDNALEASSLQRRI